MVHRYHMLIGGMIVITKETMMKTIFSQALETLLVDKELEEIHTSEIIKLSGLSRGSFYKYFRDKYALANWKLENLMDSLATQFSGPEEQEENLKATFEHIYANRSIYKKLFKYTGQNSITEFYINAAIFHAKQVKISSGRQFKKRDEYIVRYHTYGILYLLNEWLFDPNPMPVDELYEIILINRSEELKKQYFID